MTPGAPKRSFLRVLSDFGLLASSAVLFALSFPSFLSDNGWFPLGFVCLVPLFIVVHRASWPAAPFYGIFFGYVSYVLFNYWLGRFHPLTLVVVPPIYAGYFLLVLPALKLADTLLPRYGFFLQSALWVCYEYFLKSRGFLAYSYGNLGYSPWPFLPFIQIASIFGVWGVSLLVVYPSALLGSALREGPAALARRWRAFVWPASAYLAVAAVVIAYGAFSQVDTSSAREWKVALVQQNVDPWKGGTRAYRHSLDVLLRQSRKAVAESPDIVIWSETSFVPAIEWHTRYREDNERYALVKELMDFLATQPVPYVVGNDDGELRRTEENQEERVDFNAAILFEKGQIVDTYRKLHLVPFTEDFPFRKSLPGIYQALKNADTHFWKKGSVPTVFDADGVRFSTPICFEDTFGYLCRGFVQRGAQVLVNMTNDAWSFSVPGAMQHMTMAVFRAIENRRSVVRSTNGGMTNIIDPNGRILQRLPPFTEGYLLGAVPVYTAARTPYTRWGDWFPWVLLAASITALAAAAARRAFRPRAFTRARASDSARASD
ncbi:MAG TPA: apolipoprotein N-acyltransferase [Spirochaetia bacterium]|nr:apolipoprotein N-acyltransferase [Spirochaetia bacterium]